jgi:hypothetical protein
LADGNVYRIEKERQGYIIKLAINESESEYIDPMKARRYYSSYSQALKRLNLIANEINVLHENEEGTSLIGEQKKKFVLKTKKKKESDEGEDAAPPPPPADVEVTPPPPADVEVTPPPPADMGSVPPPPADMGETPPPPADMGGEMPTDMGAGSSTEMGGEMPTDMGAGSTPPADMGGEEEIDVEEKPRKRKISDLKRIQILVGKLAQKIRSYEEEKDLSNKEIKYIINSILSAIDVDTLDEDDIEQIISRLEGSEDEDGEEVSFEEEDTEVQPGVAPEPPQEPEMSEGFDNIGDAFVNHMGGALAYGMSKKLQHEDDSDFYDSEGEYHRERRRGRKHIPNPKTLSHGTFSESKVDKLLSKYFIFTEEEVKNYELKKERKRSETYKSNKQNIVRLSESTDQLNTALDYIRVNPRVKLMGLSTKGNLVFKEGINEVKITKSGQII